MPDTSLLDRYARRFGLAAPAAEARLFFECVPAGKRLAVRLHRCFRPRLYASDLRLVHEAGQAMSRQEVMDALDRWNHRASGTLAWEREVFGWRVSGRLLLAVARTLFQATDMAAGRGTRPAVPMVAQGEANRRQPMKAVPTARESGPATGQWIELGG